MSEYSAETDPGLDREAVNVDGLRLRLARSNPEEEGARVEVRAAHDARELPRDVGVALVGSELEANLSRDKSPEKPKPFRYERPTLY